ncbi:MAG TPA: transcriptional repressor [Trichormus sp.]|jgi:Fe2+ or Zn2+ uptake regulation protein
MNSFALMNADDNNSKKRTARGPLRWEQSYRLLELLQRNPNIGAAELQIEGASIGIEISIRTAFRFLERFRRTDGNIFNCANNHLQTVTAILQSAAPGKPLSPYEISQAALERGVSLHLATVYRILRKLVGTGTLVQQDDGHKTLYEWKREQAPHGRISCVACGQTVAFEKEYLNAMAQNICSAFDFEHDHLELTLFARCRNCRG